MRIDHDAVVKALEGRRFACRTAVRESPCMWCGAPVKERQQILWLTDERYAVHYEPCAKQARAHASRKATG